MTVDETGEEILPASIAMAWGLQERPGRGPKRGLSLERIIATAIDVADTDGLTALSMGRVAADLGVTTMALYRYVGSKDELLILMTDSAYGPPPPAAEPREGWRAALSAWARALMDALRAHPWVLRVPVDGYPAAPNQLAWLEAGLASAEGTGLDAGQRLSTVLTLTGFVRSQAALSTDVANFASAEGKSDQEATSAYARLLEKLVTPARFPALTAVIMAGVMDRQESADAEFLFGLERFLDGIAVLADSQA
ncbi:TetR/AcrR family transcriptional regulator [Actinomadura sp. WMMA1423]|uniref:TetR/AcrR family transcriptional regulator n=1 Tax=Actinomadura sp. WMMA1423 TaxID=2591108 RepID=UPI0011470C63|nr:TetR/AcrR family transcriptional regulator [Actinomadura sp. WMMA1423]